MIICKCGREFKSNRSIANHRRLCGKKKISIDSHGYEYYIGNNGKPIFIHRENMEKKLGRKLGPDEHVHHKDDNKRNNDELNLELTNNSGHTKEHWSTMNSDRIKLFGPKLGSKNGSSKLTEQDVVIIKQNLRDGHDINSIATEYSVHPMTICNIKNGNSWKHVD